MALDEKKAGELSRNSQFKKSAWLFYLVFIFLNSNCAPATLIQVDYADVIGSGPTYLGVEYGWLDQDSELYLERYRNLHENVIRVQIAQEMFEPSNDNSDAGTPSIMFNRTIPIDNGLGKTINFERMFTQLAQAFPEMIFQINVWMPTKWNGTSPNGYLGLGGVFPPLDFAEHSEFIQQLAQWLVEVCGISPKHLHFTFINEPNLPAFFLGSQADLVKMANVTRKALNQVSPDIKMGGLDEVHGTGWTTEFYRQKPIGCCDFWTYHVYERGITNMMVALIGRAKYLKQYGPVWVTEFADTTNGSPDGGMDFSSRSAAIGYAQMLGGIWTEGIEGIVHFRLSDTYSELLGNGGWAGHGLFADAHGTHAEGKAFAIFPSYWVFANAYDKLGGKQVVRNSSPADLKVVSVKGEYDASETMVIWITNHAPKNRNFSLMINNYPFDHALIEVYDVLQSNTPIITYKDVTVNGDSLKYELPGQSSYMFVFK